MEQDRQQPADKRPEKTFRLGPISASVFVNQAESGRRFRSIIPQRSYRGEDGERQFTSSFNVGDLPALQRVLQLAQEFVEKLEVVVDVDEQ